MLFRSKSDPFKPTIESCLTVKCDSNSKELIKSASSLYTESFILFCTSRQHNTLVLLCKALVSMYKATPQDFPEPRPPYIDIKRLSALNKGMSLFGICIFRLNSLYYYLYIAISL